MEVKLLQLGLFEKYNSIRQTHHFNTIQINNYYNETAFQFELKINDDEEFKLTPKGGYFLPSKAETIFYEKDKDKIVFNRIIKRQPDFFAFILPYPQLKRTSPRFKFPTAEWAFNPQPFSHGRFNGDLKEKRFSYMSLKSDLEQKLLVSHSTQSNHRINDFIENNCYPIFVEAHDELCILMNDYLSFIKQTINADLSLKSFSKNVIPFFEINETEAKQISKTKSDTLPW